MKTQFGFIDPGAIMGVVVSLIILGVGVFAFFVVINEVRPTWAAGQNWSNLTSSDQTMLSRMNNTSATGDSVFNIIGIVLIIGAIMSIVGLVYNYVR
jgi:beta-lactamase regulating signal transducer with metallopeptidase domain